MYCCRIAAHRLTLASFLGVLAVITTAWGQQPPAVPPALSALWSKPICSARARTGMLMHAFRFIRIALLACTLTACAGRGPATTPPTLHNSQPPTLSDLLRPYEISARKTSATEAPVVGGTFEPTHSVPVPPELGRRAFGTP